MKLWPKRRKQSTTRYWVNGHGPFDTIEERDQMHAMLKDLAEWNRRGYARIQERIDQENA